VKIAMLVEGRTEMAFLPYLREFLKPRLVGRMPKLDPVPYSRIPKGEQLKREVEKLLRKADAVIALTDVYTGTNPPDFDDAEDAKNKMRNWVGGIGQFYPHAAQYEFEAWLLPFWNRIQQLAGSTRTTPGAYPEQVNHTRPPSHHISEAYRTGIKGDRYVKALDAPRILRGRDLFIAVQACPELKALVNTILRLCGGEAIP
jgi:hypothetical protein